MGESLSRFVRVVGRSKVRGNLSVRMGCVADRYILCFELFACVCCEWITID